MATSTQSLQVLVASAHQLEAALAPVVAAPVALSGALDQAVAVPVALTLDGDVLIGPILRNVIDVAVAATYALPLDTNVLVGPGCFASLDVRTAATDMLLGAGLDTAVAFTTALPVDVDAAVAEPRTKALCLHVTVAAESSATACMSLAVCDHIALRYIQPSLSILIGERRDMCPMDLDVNVGTGVSVSSILDLLVKTISERSANLTVNVRSPALKIAASAVYSPDGDVVQSYFFVEDAGEYRPDWVESMTATLLYRGEHELGSIEFDASYATDTSDVRLFWLHPAHYTDLSVRYEGVVYSAGDIELTVPVGQESAAQTFFMPQPLRGVDAVPPRTEWSTYQTLTTQLDAAPEEVLILDSSASLVTLHVDLTTDPSLLVGEGSIQYSGGGNRLLASLNDDGSFVLQPVDTLPSTIGAYTMIEDAGTNLLDNSNFLSTVTTPGMNFTVPTGWTVTSSASVTTFASVVDPDSVLNMFEVRAIGSGPYTGAKHVDIAYDETVSIVGPVTFSVLGRVSFTEGAYADIPETGVKVDTFDLVVSFRDVADDEISQQVVTYAPTDLNGETFVLLRNAVPAPPAGTVGVRVSVRVQSIEASDDIKIFLMAPQVEPGSIATSRIIGATAPTVRAADVLLLPQAGNLELRRGSIVLDVAAAYSGTPPADACLFDTRTTAQNGFALYHLMNGKLRFIVAGATTTKTLESAAVTFGFGEAHSVAVSWHANLMAIALDGDELVRDETTVLLPQVLGESIVLFNSETGTERFIGQLTTFRIERDIQQ